MTEAERGEGDEKKEEERELKALLWLQGSSPFLWGTGMLGVQFVSICVCMYIKKSKCYQHAPSLQVSLHKSKVQSGSWEAGSVQQ